MPSLDIIKVSRLIVTLAYQVQQSFHNSIFSTDSNRVFFFFFWLAAKKKICSLVQVGEKKKIIRRNFNEITVDKRKKVVLFLAMQEEKYKSISYQLIGRIINGRV